MTPVFARNVPFVHPETANVVGAKPEADPAAIRITTRSPVAGDEASPPVSVPESD